MSDYGGRLIRDTEPTVTSTTASGIWTIEEALKYKKAGTWPTFTTDPNFKQTVLLLHGDGTNGAQNNTFLDSSTNNFTITRNGNTTQGTFSPFSVGVGEWSNYFDGNTDYLSYPDNTAFQFGTGEFTVEAWVYPTATPGVNYTHIVGSQEYGLSGTWVLGIDTNLNLRIFASALNGTGSATATGGTVPLNTWSYVAMVRSGSTLKGYVNGVEVCSVANSANINSAGYVGTIGADTNGDEAAFTGYISNVRIVKGGALNVTSVPTSPFTTTVSSGTVSLLTCQSNRFVDNSTNNFTITRNGDVRVTPFSPFAPTAAYSAGTNGGSGYFDGSGDYLSITDNSAFDLGSGDFTIEAWVYPQSLSNNGAILTQWPSLTNNSYIFLYFATTGRPYFAYSTSGGDVGITGTTTSVTLNTWNHIAVTRSGSTIRLFVNGVQDATTGNIGTAVILNSSAEIRISRLNATDGDCYVNGYMSNVRLVKGTALYTSNFTPSTTPLTAITNTSLLLNFTNAGIIDNTGKNNLETVGNAQIDTTTKKFGTGSLEFDGTGDWLLVPNNDQLIFRAGDFTVEGWFYGTSNAASMPLFSIGRFDAGILLRINSHASNDSFYINSTSYNWNPVSNFPLNQWNHVAVTRAGSAVRIFVNGTQVFTTTNSADINQTTATLIGAQTHSPATVPFIGYIDDFRITKGVARYTANFTAPTAPFLDQ